jgi:phosphate transport system permease protein
MRSWPKGISFLLTAVPVLMLLAVISLTVWQSMPAIKGIGIGEIFSTEFVGKFTASTHVYGMLPAIWGTVMVVILALGIALPASLALAVISSEFRLGVVSRSIRNALTLLSGIPPIVYALLMVVFVELIMKPKFSLNNNTLLGGLMVALMIIPFMAPLIDDAIKNVPRELKEGSLALGMSRWHTLWHITLPNSMAGIISAISLGSLKAIGDLIIVTFAIGYERPAAAPDMTNPLWDILESTPTLTSSAANLAGGFQVRGSCEGYDCAVAYLTALFLLIIAFGIMILLTIITSRLKKVSIK